MLFKKIRNQRKFL